MGKGSGRVPFDKLPKFKEGNQDPSEFLEDLQRHLVAYEVDEERYLAVFPMCLDADANRWLTRWTEQARKERSEISWDRVKKAFSTRFQHHHRSAVLKEKWRSLRMAPNAAGKYCDMFLQLMTQLDLEPTDEQVVYQFKVGLTEGARRQVSNALAPLLLSGVDKTISVLDLAKVVVGMEAESKLSSNPNSSPLVDKKRKDNGLFCTRCQRGGHDISECRSKGRSDTKPMLGSDNKATSVATKGTALTGKELEQAKADREAGACFRCHKTGHQAKDCPSVKSEKK
jgi:hypothetical protein